MKLFSKTVCAFSAAVFLFLTGCAQGRSNDDFTGLTTSFSLQAQAIYHKEKISFSLTRTARSIYRFEFPETDLLRELTVSLNGDEVTTEYDGITRNASVSQLPQTGMMTAIPAIIDLADLAKTARYDKQSNTYLIADTAAFGEFTATVCAKTNLPLQLSAPSIDLTVIFEQ